MDFSQALDDIKDGRRLARTDAGWKAKYSFVYLVPGSTFQVSRPPLLGIYPEGFTITYRPHIDVAHVDGTCGVWNPTMEDVMASDWIEVDSSGHPLRS